MEGEPADGAHLRTWSPRSLVRGYTPKQGQKAYAADWDQARIAHCQQLIEMLQRLR